ncbi:MAG TPA: hypothetical protein VIZ17_05545 [Acetobacteraceae bacterium]
MNQPLMIHPLMNRSLMNSRWGIAFFPLDRLLQTRAARMRP